MKTRFWLVAAVVSTLGARAFADGNVLATVDPTTGLLTLTGDGASNSLDVTAGTNPGDVVVTGSNGTTVNGGASAPFSGVTGLASDLGAGADALTITGVKFRKSLRVLFGDGADSLTLSNVNVHGRTSVRGGSGPDRVVVKDQSHFHGVVFVQTADGDDDVQFRDSGFDHFLRLDTGAGVDNVLVQNCEFTSVAPLQITTGDGDDTVDLEGNTFHDDVLISMGAGDDHLTLGDNNFNKDLDASGGGGNDDRVSIDSGNNFKIRRPPHFHGFEHL